MYRLVDHYDTPTYQCLTCHGYVEGYVEGWTYCPLCGEPLGDKLVCRQRGYPKWAWRRGIEPPEPKMPEPTYWEVQKRYIPPETYNKGDYSFGRDLFEWSPDWHCWPTHDDKRDCLDYLRQQVEDEKETKFGTFAIEWRIVYRTKYIIRRVYQPEWARVDVK